MPRLRVLAGPSPSSLTPIDPNSNHPHMVQSDAFEGSIVVHVKNFPDEEGNVVDSEYFYREDRQNTTWSIQVQGRFLQPRSADDIMFGNTFDRPLKLPWGSGAALKFMHFIDPTLDHDLQSRYRPWALSPLISTMPHFVHTPLSNKQSIPQFPSPRSLKDDTSYLKFSPSIYKEGARRNAQKRRAFFSQSQNREAVTFGPKDIITTDFCYGFIKFPQLSLCLPGGLSFDLMKYWDGQPVRFVCCERAKNGQNAADAETFWCVSIELVSDDGASSGSDE